MFRSIIIIGLFITMNAQAMNEAEKAYCKENPGKCSDSSERRYQPNQSTGKDMPSGPDWNVVTGDLKKQILEYLAQVALVTSYSNCFIQNGVLFYGEPPASRRTLLINLESLKFSDQYTLEQHKRSERPLFRLDRAIREELRAEFFFTTDKKRTRIEHIAYQLYSIENKQYYTGPLDKPQLVIERPKIISNTESCIAIQ